MNRISILILLLLFARMGFGQYSNQATAIDSLFEKYTSMASPGLAVVVVKEGRVVFSKGYGLAVMQHKVPISSSTLFDLASVSKQFTAYSILLLEETGKLSLQDDIRKYLPEMHDFGKKITIDHLLRHTSGLRDWPSSLGLAGQNMLNISFNQILDFAFNQRELNFGPGAEYSYSNTGYNLLAEIVQRISGQSFRIWCDSVIFKPLDMSHTFVYNQAHELIQNVAFGYDTENGKYITQSGVLMGQGSSSVFSSVDDMAKWMIEMDNPTSAASNIFKRMFEQGKLNSDSQISYARGLAVSSYRGVKEISHSGSWGAFGSYMMYFPDQHLSVLVMQNCYDSPVKKAREVADLFLINAEPVISQSIPEFKFVSLSPDLLRKFTGTYKLGPAWYVNIVLKDSVLIAIPTAENPVPFPALSDSSFMAFGQPFMFYKNALGQFDGFIYRGMKCPKVTVNKVNLKEFVGEYESVELKASYRITIENDTLTATNCKNGKIMLLAACNEDFKGNWFMSSVEFYKGRNGRTEGFFVTVNRSRKQRFVKK